MVKNTTGGKGSKSFARKLETAKTNGSHRLRIPTNEFEMFAIVTQALGNCMFYVSTISGSKLLLRIRGKFTGRNKRHNLVQVGNFVLVGLHDFEKPNYKTSDLLEIYTDVEVKQLSSLPQFDNSFFRKKTDSLTQEEDDNYFADEDIAVIGAATAIDSTHDQLFAVEGDELIDIDDI